jgi:hypothetical protein
VTYEDITAAHIREWGETIIPDDNLICGFACRDATGRLAALFCAFPFEGRWWATFDRNERCTLSVHRQVLKALDALAAVDIDGKQAITELWALCDEARPRAREWMEHVGFRPVNEMEWKLGLSRACGGMARLVGRNSDHGGRIARAGRLRRGRDSKGRPQGRDRSAGCRK